MLFDKIPTEYRKRFFLLSFCINPIFILAGLAGGLFVGRLMFGDLFDASGMVIVSLVMFPLFFIMQFCITYRIASSKRQ